MTIILNFSKHLLRKSSRSIIHAIRGMNPRLKILSNSERVQEFFIKILPTNCYAKHTFHEQRVNASRVEGKTNYTRSPISQTGAFLRVPKRTKKPTPQYINPARSKQNRTKKKLRNQTRHQQRFPLSRRRSEQHCKHRIPPLLYHGSWSARCNQLLLSTFQSQSTRKTPFPSRLKNST